MNKKTQIIISVTMMAVLASLILGCQMSTNKTTIESVEQQLGKVQNTTASIQQQLDGVQSNTESMDVDISNLKDLVSSLRQENFHCNRLTKKGQSKLRNYKKNRLLWRRTPRL